MFPAYLCQSYAFTSQVSNLYHLQHQVDPGRYNFYKNYSAFHAKDEVFFLLVSCLPVNFGITSGIVAPEEYIFFNQVTMGHKKKTQPT